MSNESAAKQKLRTNTEWARDAREWYLEQEKLSEQRKELAQVETAIERLEKSVEVKGADLKTDGRILRIAILGRDDLVKLSSDYPVIEAFIPINHAIR